MKRALGWSALPIALAGCAADYASDRQQQFTGWMYFRHELMLFKYEKDYLAFRKPCLAGQDCERPVCISGIFAGDPPLGLGGHNGKRVTVTGRLISYRSLPDDDVPILTGKVFADRPVSDYCLRDEMILVSTVTPL